MLGARLKDLILSSEALGASQVALVVKTHTPSLQGGGTSVLLKGKNTDLMTGVEETKGGLLTLLGGTISL